MAKDKAKIDAHVLQWKHNRDLISVLPASHPDWIVTVIFYAAVHAVDAALAAEQCRPWNHETRFEAIAKLPQMQKIGVLYHPLYDLSRKVRYLANPDVWIPPSDIDKQVVKRLLMPLERSVQNRLGEELGLPLIDLRHLQGP